MGADQNYRPNPSRAIHVNGQIDQDLVKRLTPEILGLRGENSDPITVYINSPGGLISGAGTLVDLLTAPDQDGFVGRTITVATGMAASAAADLLAAGDHAIVYPNTYIHFHGVRQTPDEEITMEMADSAANYLREKNEHRAASMARHCFRRIIFLLASGRGMPKHGEGKGNVDITAFGHYLMSKTSPGADRIIHKTLRRYHEVQDLIRMGAPVLSGALSKKKSTTASSEARLLTFLISYELKRNRKDATWSFTEGGLQKLVEDFNLFNDFLFKQNSNSLRPLCETWGHFFLSPTEKTEFRAKATLKESDDYLDEHAHSDIRRVWYFTLSLCRFLQERENPLTALDARWLGIVDEVLGSNLPNIRLVVENAPPEPSET